MLTTMQSGWCPWCGTMMGGGGLMMFFWAILLVAIVAFFWVAVTRGRMPGAGPSQEDRAESILRERYARGEIDEANYERMLDELRR